MPEEERPDSTETAKDESTNTSRRRQSSQNDRILASATCESPTVTEFKLASDSSIRKTKVKAKTAEYEIENSHDSVTNRPRLYSISAAKAEDTYRGRARRSFRKQIQNVPTSMRISLREAMRNKGSYIQGCCSIWLVVVIVSILVTTIFYTPIISLSLAEIGAGEIDLRLIPKNGNSFNLTAINQRITRSQSPEKVTSRLEAAGVTLYPPIRCLGANSTDLLDNGYPYTGIYGTRDISRSTCDPTESCFSDLCTRSVSADLYLFDWDKEREHGIGRSWRTWPTPPKGHAYLQEDLAEYLEVSPGNVIFMDFLWSTINNTYRETMFRYNGTSFNPTGVAASSASFPVTIQAIFATPQGKLNSELQSLIIMDTPTFLEHVADYLHPDYPAGWGEDLKQRDLEEYSYALIFSCTPLPRINCYLDSDYPSIARRILTWSSEIYTRFGIDYATTEIPLLSALDASRYLSAFLGMLLSLVIIVLGGLSTFLIYSLLLVSVETRTFEMGILRMIGMTRPLVLQLLVVQALSYSFPALVTGLLTAQGLYVALKGTLSSLLQIELPWNLVGDSVVAAFILGIIVPLGSSVIPIQKALKYNIRESLSRRSSFQAVQISLERTSAIFPPVSLLVYGLVMAGGGFGIYYFLPKALVEQDLTTLFSIFLVLLIAMVFGLVLLALNLQPFLQIMLTYIIVIPFLENQALRTLTTKNLAMHRSRNKKTSMLYALALGFLIFINVTTDVELKSLEYTTLKSVASDIKIYNSFYRVDGSPVGLRTIEELEDFADSSPSIENWAWVTQRMDGNAAIEDTSITNFGRIANFPNLFWGVSPGFLNTAGSDFVSVRNVFDRSSLGNLALSEAIYEEPAGRAVMGARYESELQLTPESPEFLLKLERKDSSIAYEKAQATAFLTAAPLFTMTEYPTPNQQDLFLSIPDYVRLSGGAVQSVEDTPIRTMLIRLTDAGKDKAARSRLKASLSNIITNLDRIEDLEDRLIGVRDAKAALEYVFLAVTVLVMVMTFFSLMTSMYVNVLEQQRDIAVLRALGLSRFALFRLYIYEALILIISAATVGAAIGAVMGWTITSQRTVLTGLPIPVVFPVQIILVVIGLSVVSAVASTIGPVGILVFRKKIVEILKG